MRIGILTGGGDCPGLNAVIRAVVKTARTSYNMEVLGFNDGYHGLITNKVRRLGRREISGIMPRGGTILGTSNRDNPFKYTEIIDGQKVTHDVSATVIDNIAKNNIDAMVVVGGDGTLAIANQLYKMGVPIVGVPKTIDNDISATGVTFGFDTALTTATDAIDKIHTTAESHHRVMIVEVMGRTAGWIALHSGLAGGAHIILIPEIPFSYDSIVNKIKERQGYGKPFSIVVVAEGAKPKGGDVVVNRIVEDASEPLRLGGIGDVVGNTIEKKIGVETRVTTLGHIQRGGTPTAFDRILSTRFGVEAVKLVYKKNFGRMVSLKTPEIVPVLLEDAVDNIKLIPPDCQLLDTARMMDINLGE